MISAIVGFMKNDSFLQALRLKLRTDIEPIFSDFDHLSAFLKDEPDSIVITDNLYLGEGKNRKPLPKIFPSAKIIGVTTFYEKAMHTTLRRDGFSGYCPTVCKDYNKWTDCIMKVSSGNKYFATE